eukprot:1146079-Pelagomonas_calceolata.AAC.1
MCRVKLSSPQEPCLPLLIPLCLNSRPLLLELRQDKGVHLRQVHDGPHQPALKYSRGAKDGGQAPAARLSQKVDAQDDHKLDGQECKGSQPEGHLVRCAWLRGGS